MTVRTDKIQALTGTAPLTLPTTLPATKTSVKVDSSGNITTPSTEVIFSALGTVSETGWVLLGVADQQDFTTNFKVSIDPASSYSGSDIYMYRMDFCLVGDRNSTGNYFTMSPMDGDTNISQAMDAGNSAGWYKSAGTGWSGGISNPSTTGTYGFENYVTWQQVNIAGENSATSFDGMYVSSSWNETTGYSYQGGTWGTVDYYNGACNRHANPVLDQVNWNKYDSSYNQNSNGHYNIQYGQGANLKKGTVTNSDFADGFIFATQGGWSGGSTSYELMGQVNLYGIPKTG